MRFLELTRGKFGDFDVGTGQAGRGPDMLINPTHIVDVRPKGWTSQKTVISVGNSFSGSCYTLNMPFKDFAALLAGWS